MAPPSSVPANAAAVAGRGAGQSAGFAPTPASRPRRASGQHHPVILLSFLSFFIFAELVNKLG